MKDVTGRAEGRVSRTLFKTTLGSKGIRPFFFQAEHIVVSLKALLLNPLKAARNSILVKVSSHICNADVSPDQDPPASLDRSLCKGTSNPRAISV